MTGAAAASSSPAKRRVARLKLRLALAPPVVGAVVFPATIAMADLLRGAGFSLHFGGFIVMGLFGLFSMVPVRLIALYGAWRKTAAHTLFATSGGILLGAPMLVWGGVTDLSSDAQAAIALVMAPILALPLGVVGAVAGLLLAQVTCLRPTFPSERLVDPFCPRCGYCLAGVAARECPECGKLRSTGAADEGAGPT